MVLFAVQILVTIFITVAINVVIGRPWIAALAGGPISLGVFLLFVIIFAGFDGFVWESLIFGLFYALPVSVIVSIICYVTGFGSRRKSLLKCAECGYDVRSTFGRRCPECGTPLSIIRRKVD